ncbi:3-hydroxybutyrate dehydrogenase [Aureimonas jatrophae]|uniref:3-hydroxybutyrate dehydrogenase n=1 Tax=Aureimonas jatrophae TaxID=1166073 RepID=A0A1H0D6L0_9HYPH|nr:3-hydroxybutyrate dehydrogenase [Aureimonas jatrophae]MBB3951732.1 3-hydroxybutyrate dehydrogenase [Aureimonas jatrophae]SDN65802.1 3-hydroxybutyrate dehydrogenase [Aureimonas jatrophae]
MQLRDRVAVVSGAASGIGRAIAELYAREGAAVAVADLDGAKAAAAATAIEAAGGRALGLAMDVTDEAAVDDGMREIERTLGPVDVMVANAGIQIVHPIEDFPYKEFRRVVDIHLGGSFLLTKAAVRQMYPRRRGSLIYMGSVHSHEASPLKSAYVAAKHAVLGLARVMAKEGGPHGVRSNVICPGFVRTPLVEKQIPEQARDLGISEEEVVSRVMLGRTVDGEFTTLDDVAAVALFLAAFPSAALTGQSITASHGWYTA